MYMHMQVHYSGTASGKILYFLLEKMQTLKQMHTLLPSHPPHSPLVISDMGKGIIFSIKPSKHPFNSF